MINKIFPFTVAVENVLGFLKFFHVDTLLNLRWFWFIELFISFTL